MKKYILTFSIVTILLFSCQEKEKQTDNHLKSKDSLKISLKNQTFRTKVTLTNDGKKYIKDWEYYFNVKDYLNNYKDTDYKASLFYAQQLLVLTKQLKDSLKIKKINNASFRSRINTIYSISLRLADMDSIPAITKKEVITETSNLFNAFDGITIKINSLARKEKLEDDLKEFDFLFSKKDSVEKNLNIKKNKNKIIAKPKKIERIKPIKNALNEKSSVPNRKFSTSKLHSKKINTKKHIRQRN